jgi:hypothetical protein
MEKPLEKPNSPEPAATIAQQLANLFAAGWTEPQIVKFTYLRAAYHLNRQKFGSTTATHTLQDRLAYIRWLYQNGRLFS